MKTLVLGGYGNFGARICRALAVDPSIQLLIGGRDRQRAQSLAQALGSQVQGLSLDFSAPDFSSSLQDLGIELLIHAAGPYQLQDYRVAQAAVAAACHYIDLSDGRQFVCDFPGAMDQAFRNAGRTAVTGASTVPALSSAVVDQLCAGWQSIASIDTCIAPAQTAPRGTATLAAVLSYCGAPIKVWDQAQWTSRLGWASPELVHFTELAPRLGALCDVPDLALFPVRYRVSQRVMFRAALEVRFTQRVLAVLARLRAIGLITQAAKLAPVLNATAPWLDFLGSSLGGMVLRVVGIDGSGREAGRAWHITADHDHGPEIPCMAAILLARKLARQQALPLGAHACMGLLTLAEFEPEFKRWGMRTQTIEEGANHGA